MDWHLFVDESGDFDDRDSGVVVTGILTHRQMDGPARARLLRQLRNAAPFMPWPLHAWVLNRPVSIALGMTAHEGSAGAPTGAFSQPAKLGPDCHRAAVLLSRARPDAWKAALAAFKADREPRYDDLSALDRALRRADRGLHRALGDRQRHLKVLLSRALRDLADCEADEAAPSLMLLSSSEAQQGDAVVPKGNKGDRYLTLLKCLLSRTVAVVGRLDGTHRICLHVLTRFVQDEVLERPVPLHHRHVARICEEVTPEGQSVRPISWEVPRYDRRVHPALILADLAANRSRLFLPRPIQLAHAEDGLRQTLQVPVRSGEPSRSHLAATGVAAGVAAGDVEVPQAAWDTPRELFPLYPQARPWALEQALEWAEDEGGEP